MTIKEGQPAPDFTAPATSDTTITLSALKGKKVVLYFYPKDSTPGCTTEGQNFRDLYPNFQEANCEILGVSVDSKFSHLAWIQTPRNQGGIGDINYPLVADLNKEIGNAFNILDDEGKALRGLYLIDPDGVIVHATINNLPVGRNVDETLRLLQAFQYVQSNPDEVCPANWTPGAATMLEDPKGSKEYFSSIG